MSDLTKLIIGGTVLAALVLVALLVVSVEEPGGVAGASPVAVRAEDFGLWRSEVEVAAGERAWIDVTLLESATVSGTVTDGQGEPLGEARVRAYDRREYPVHVDVK